MARPMSPKKPKVLKISWRERGVLKRIVSVAGADKNPIIPGEKPRPVPEPTLSVPLNTLAPWR